MLVVIIVILYIIIALLALYIRLAPIGECDHCLHCRYKRIEKFIKKQEEALEQEILQTEYEHENGMVIPDECNCDTCKERIRRRNSG